MQSPNLHLPQTEALGRNSPSITVGRREQKFRIADEVPDLLVVLDLLEFCARSVAQPIQRDFHSYFGHYHLDFDRDAGLAELVASVDRLFARNGVAFELTAQGIVRRLGPPILVISFGRPNSMPGML